MLELDIVLEKFVRQCYPQMPESEQALYRKLLECEDQQLFDWFLKKRAVDRPELVAMVDKILAYQVSAGT